MRLNSAAIPPSCRFYPSGKCRQGDACVFNHDIPLVTKSLPSPPIVTVSKHTTTEITDALTGALLTQWRGDGDHNAHTHGFHPRKALMNPETVKILLSLVHLKGAVFDPFCGSGTTTVETMLANRFAVGCDLSPLAVGIARAHSWLGTEGEISELTTIVRSLEVEDNDIDSLRSVVQKAASSTTNSNLSLALLFILDYELAYKWEAWRKPKTLLKRFQRTSERYILKIVGLRAAVSEGTRSPLLITHDAKISLRDTKLLEGELVAGVVTSPPYPGVYNYVVDDLQSFNKSGLVDILLDKKHDVSDAQEVGSRSQRDNDDVNFADRWQKDTVSWLIACADIMQVGGRILILIGDEGEINSFASISEACEEIGVLHVIGCTSIKGEHAARRPWKGGRKRNYRTEHCIALEKLEKF